jgi:hypothetical protein
VDPVVFVIDLSADAADRFTVPPRNEKLNVCVLEERIRLWC